MTAHRIDKYPIHLGRNATAVAEPEFTGTMDWYFGYVARHESDGLDGRLVSQFAFDRPWDAWEMHPNGSEVVLCTAGRITLHQEHADGTRDTVALAPGEYAINPPGTWHTADVTGEATAVFITAGVGTQHRPRTG
jgi:quercetin dioxygenase-like cupin family protein